MNPIILYHAACPDGFAASWVAAQALKARNPELRAVKYHEAVPDVTGRDVYMLDFCYPRPVIEHMRDTAASLTIIDHHATAQRELDGFTIADGKGSVTFDMNRSGAGMTWDHFWPTFKRPWVIDYVEDRDLWRWALPDSQVINAYLGTLQYDFDAWDKAQALGVVDLSTIVMLGQAVLAKVAHYCSEMRRNVAHVEFMGMRVPIVNAPQINISELLASLLDECGIALGWSQDATGRYIYSIRTTDAIDAGKLAKRFGGGGHPKAAGFSTSFAPEPQFPGLFERCLLDLERLKNELV